MCDACAYKIKYISGIEKFHTMIDEFVAVLQIYMYKAIYSTKMFLLSFFFNLFSD